MKQLVVYPLLLIEFYYIDGVHHFLKSMGRTLKYTILLLSIPQLLQTYARPLKNEYREGLIVFSVVTGIFVKSILLFISCIGLLAVALAQVLMLAVYILLPAFLIYLMFI